MWFKCGKCAHSAGKDLTNCSISACNEGERKIKSMHLSTLCRRCFVRKFKGKQWLRNVRWIRVRSVCVCLCRLNSGKIFHAQILAAPKADFIHTFEEWVQKKMQFFFVASFFPCSGKCLFDYFFIHFFYIRKLTIYKHLSACTAFVNYNIFFSSFIAFVVLHRIHILSMRWLIKVEVFVWVWEKKICFRVHVSSLLTQWKLHARSHLPPLSFVLAERRKKNVHTYIN